MFMIMSKIKQSCIFAGAVLVIQIFSNGCSQCDSLETDDQVLRQVEHYLQNDRRPTETMKALISPITTLRSERASATIIVIRDKISGADISCIIRAPSFYYVRKKKHEQEIVLGAVSKGECDNCWNADVIQISFNKCGNYDDVTRTQEKIRIAHPTSQSGDGPRSVDGSTYCGPSYWPESEIHRLLYQ
jgi:hypothetical protein